MVKKYVLYIGVVVYVVVIPFLFISYLRTPKFLIQTDVISFLTGAKIVKDGKIEHLYEINTQYEYQNTIVSPDKKGLLPFRNFPITAAFYIPLLGLSLKNSYIVIFVVNVLLLCLSVYLFMRLLPALKTYVVLYFVPFFFWPSVNNLIVGQYTPVILLILLAVYVSQQREKSFWTGFVTSFLFIKPQYLLFTPFSYAISTNKKKYIIGFVVGALIFIVINLAITQSIKPGVYYLSFVFGTESSIFGSRPYQMYTLYGAAMHFFPGINPQLLVISNMFLYLLCTFSILARRKTFTVRTLFSLGIILTLLFSMHALTHDLLVILIPAFLFLGSDLPKKRYPVVSVLIFLVGLTTLFPLSLPTIFALIFICGFLLKDKHSYAPEHHKQGL